MQEHQELLDDFRNSYNSGNFKRAYDLAGKIMQVVYDPENVKRKITDKKTLEKYVSGLQEYADDGDILSNRFHIGDNWNAFITNSDDLLDKFIEDENWRLLKFDDEEDGKVKIRESYECNYNPESPFRTQILYFDKKKLTAEVLFHPNLNGEPVAALAITNLLNYALENDLDCNVPLINLYWANSITIKDFQKFRELDKRYKK